MNPRDVYEVRPSGRMPIRFVGRLLADAYSDLPVQIVARVWQADGGAWVAAVLTKRPGSTSYRVARTSTDAAAIARWLVGAAGETGLRACQRAGLPSHEGVGA